MLALALAIPLVAADRLQCDLFDGFATDWRSAWNERTMAKRGNAIHLDEAQGERFLRVESGGSASALWRPVAPEMEDAAELTWRWRVASSLDHLDNERAKSQDDYAARIAVMFEGKPFGRKTPTVMYVWAGREPVGSMYPSPYTSNVATIVLRSGTPSTADWVLEHRDLREDFEKFFGRRPGKLTGVALMVDTDNTDSRATAWFTDLLVGAAPTEPAEN